MGQLFGASKPKPDASLQRAQRRQAKTVDDQTAEEARELGARNRLINRQRNGGGLLSRRTGAQGVKDTLG